MKVLHLITGLGTGGAEAMLVKLISCETSPESQIVVSLSKGGSNKALLQRLGVRVIELDLRRWWRLPFKLFGVNRMLSEENIQVVHAWMYHAALFSCLLALLSSGYRKRTWLWNIRHSLELLNNEKTSMQLIIRLLGKLSWIPSFIVFNSQKSILEHQNYWNMAHKARFLANGFDTENWQPNTESEEPSSSLQAIFGEPLSQKSDTEFSAKTRWLGHVGRAHPMKNHDGLIAAFAEIESEFPYVNLLLVGKGTEKLIVPVHLKRRVVLLGERQDVAKLMAQLDYFILCSKWGEGFPNVLGEAMACGITCATTNVGDSAFLLDNPDLTVKADSQSDLVGVLRRLFAMDAESLKLQGEINRTRILECFTLPLIHQAYIDLYNEARPSRTDMQ